VLTAIFQLNLGQLVFMQRMMEVVVTTGLLGAISRAKLQANHHHQQTNIQFFTGRMPFLSPNQQCRCTGGNNITFHGLAYPKLTWRSSNFVSLTTNSSWFPVIFNLGRKWKQCPCCMQSPDILCSQKVKGW